jgi:hypothetical protein
MQSQRRSRLLGRGRGLVRPEVTVRRIHPDFSNFARPDGFEPPTLRFEA